MIAVTPNLDRYAGADFGLAVPDPADQTRRDRSPMTTETPVETPPTETRPWHQVAPIGDPPSQKPAAAAHFAAMAQAHWLSYGAGITGPDLNRDRVRALTAAHWFPLQAAFTVAALLNGKPWTEIEDAFVDGVSVGEFIWQWLAEAGIEPETIAPAETPDPASWASGYVGRDVYDQAVAEAEHLRSMLDDTRLILSAAWPVWLSTVRQSWAALRPALTAMGVEVPEWEISEKGAADTAEAHRPAHQIAPISTRERQIIEALWQIIDNIDTADDMAKNDDKAFRRIVMRQQVRRWETGITTDGYRLTMPWESSNDDSLEAAASAGDPTPREPDGTPVLRVGDRGTWRGTCTGGEVRGDDPDKVWVAYVRLDPVPASPACTSCGAALDSPGCVPGEDRTTVGHTTGGGCAAAAASPAGGETQ